MDYRLKSLYEQMLKGKSIKKVSSDNGVDTAKKNLKNAYDQVLTSQDINYSSLQELSKITGIEDNNVLQKLYKIYEFVKDNDVFKKQVQLTPGSPPTRAYDSSMELNFNNLLSLLKETKFNNKKFIVTFSSKVRKLRTPRPLGQRIAEWSSITSQQVNNLENEIYNKKRVSPLAVALKPLIIFAIYKNLPDKIEFVTKMPPGIGAEMAQVEAFNNNLNGISPTQLFLPGDNLPVPGVLFDKARKIEGVGKADIALCNNNEDVFWISFKEGSYLPSNEKGAIPEFQQWGSLKSLYKTDSNIQDVIDSFLTKAVEQYKTIAFDVFDPLTQKTELLEELKRQKININPILKDLAKSKKIYIVKEKIALFADLQANKTKQSELINLALKAIYGNNFQKGKNFGPENVNLILETPTPISFEFLRENDDVVGLKLSLTQNSHIIKNPDLPESENYLPCLYLRRTSEERFLFNNLMTNNVELILAGRTLVYPTGRAKKEKAKEIKIS